MIDLHSHILPGIDDGAKDTETSVAMARIAVADGTRVLACTPHVKRGVWNNEGPDIVRRVAALQDRLNHERIPLHLVAGADVHAAPNLASLLGNRVPTLGGTRYFLFEPPHQILPPNLVEHTQRIVQAGYVPILTHPERLVWVSSRYDVFESLNRIGCLVQITAGAVMGAFGPTAEALAIRMVEEGRVDIIASDAHDISKRPPGLRAAAKRVAEIVGLEDAKKMVRDRPAQILRNEPLKPARAGTRGGREPAPRSGLGQLLRSFGGPSRG